MRARTQPGRTKPYEYYACDGRFSGSTACTEPVIPREEIDRAIWRSFETVGLDHQAMEREHEERRSLELIDLADRVAEAEREVATAAERIERVEGDYLAGELSADRYERLLDRCESERDAAAAALDQLRGREQELREAERLRDAEEDVLRELQAIREALAGFITGAGDLEGARAALRRVFESFTFHRYGSTRPGGPRRRPGVRRLVHRPGGAHRRDPLAPRGRPRQEGRADSRAGSAGAANHALYMQ